ncbi:MAG: periplasmic heavy metal sensor [Nitrospirales bacterium]
MTQRKQRITHRVFPLMLLGVMLVMLGGPSASLGQTQSSGGGSQNAARADNEHQAMLDHIMELRAQVAKLQVAVQQSVSKSIPGSRMKMGGNKAMVVMDDMGSMGSGQKHGTSPGSSGGMGMMEKEGEMGGMSSGGSSGMSMEDDQSEMDGMSSSGKGSSGDAKGMCCMGEMGAMRADMMRPGAGMGGMKGLPSTMPGQAGASHLYHIGSTGFFLDHPKHITLTKDQTRTLNRLKEKALVDRTTQQRRIDQAEQELYLLTGADQPDAAQIQAKVAEIEKLRADRRMNFIRAVGEAANVLTHDQHQTLLGAMEPTQK